MDQQEQSSLASGSNGAPVVVKLDYDETKNHFMTKFATPNPKLYYAEELTKLRFKLGDHPADFVNKFRNLILHLDRNWDDSAIPELILH